MSLYNLNVTSFLFPSWIFVFSSQAGQTWESFPHHSESELHRRAEVYSERRSSGHRLAARYWSQGCCVLCGWCSARCHGNIYSYFWKFFFVFFFSNFLMPWNNRTHDFCSFDCSFHLLLVWLLLWAALSSPRSTMTWSVCTTSRRLTKWMWPRQCRVPGRGSFLFI